MGRIGQNIAHVEVLLTDLILMIWPLGVISSCSMPTSQSLASMRTGEKTGSDVSLSLSFSVVSCSGSGASGQNLGISCPCTKCRDPATSF